MDEQLERVQRAARELDEAIKALDGKYQVEIELVSIPRFVTSRSDPDYLHELTVSFIAPKVRIYP